MKEWRDILERLIWKVTSGRFIFTVVVAAVYAFLACNQMMSEERINEITLIVLYAYFSRPRLNGHNGDEGDKDKDEERPENSDISDGK